MPQSSTVKYIVQNPITGYSGKYGELLETFSLRSFFDLNIFVLPSVRYYRCNVSYTFRSLTAQSFRRRFLLSICLPVDNEQKITAQNIFVRRSVWKTRYNGIIICKEKLLDHFVHIKLVQDMLNTQTPCFSMKVNKTKIQIIYWLKSRER